MDAVTVNVVVHDTKCASYMDRVSVQVLFLCTHCTHASRTLPTLIEHIHECKEQPVDKIPSVDTIASNEQSIDAETWGMIAKASRDVGTTREALDILMDASVKTRDSPTRVSNERDIVAEHEVPLQDNASFVKCQQDIDLKLNKLIDLLNEVKQPDATSIHYEPHKSLEIRPDCISLAGQNEDDDKLVHIELIKDPTLLMQNKTENIYHKRQCNTRPYNAVDEQDTDFDDVSTHFHDDVDADPDFVIPSKTGSTKTSSLKAQSELSNTSNENSLESDIGNFVKQYVEFVAKSIDDLFRRKGMGMVQSSTDSAVDTLPYVVEDTSDNFDFTTDVKTVLQVPGLRCHKRPAKTWRCVDCPDEDLLSSTDLDLHVKCHRDGQRSKFMCHLCKRRSATLKNHLTNWPIMRSHLTSVHDIDFELQCENCDKTMPSIEQLDVHRNKVHKLSCKYGKLSTKDPKRASKHVAKSTEGNLVGSAAGNTIKRATKSTVRDSGKSSTEEPANSYAKYASCKFTCFDATEMSLHERCHDAHNVGVLRCPACQFVGSRKRGKYQEIRQHIEEKHQDVLTQKYTCPGCSEGFHTESVYKEHYYACAHIQHLYHRCMFCTRDNSLPVVAIHDHLAKDRKLFGFKDKVRKAMKLLKEGKTMHEVYSELLVKTVGVGVKEDFGVDGNDGESQVYKCSLCYKKLKTKNSYERHMFKCHPDGHDETICQLCGKMFRTKNQYRNHYIQVHQGVKRKYVHRPPKPDAKPKPQTLLKCSQCEYTSPHQTRIRNHHMSVHMGIWPYKCKKCDYATNEVSDLRRHQNKHLGIKRYTCAHCDYKASHHWLLVAHCKRQHEMAVPKKRQPFNFMGSDGSMRWQRKREKERDLHRRMTSVYPPAVVPDVKNFQQVLEGFTVQGISGSMASAELTASRIINSVADDQEQLNVYMQNAEAEGIDNEDMLNIVEETEQDLIVTEQGSLVTQQGSVLTEQGSCITEQSSDQVQYIMRENTDANGERIVYVNSQQPVSVANTNQSQTVYLLVNP